MCHDWITEGHCTCDWQNTKDSDIICGVSQGIILDALLFSRYINDINRYLLYSKVLLYAEGTVL